MKRITDTYTALNGPKWHITCDTVIDIADPVAKEQILHIASGGKPGKCVEKISVFPIDAQILEKAREVFGQMESAVADSYILLVQDGQIRIYTDTENGVRYAACAIARHYDGGIAEGILYNVPLAPFRAVKVYIPAKEHIPFFLEFIKMCMYYGYNTLVMEVGGAMEYKSHPEINEGWEEYCQIFQEYTGKSIDVQMSLPWNKNSIHWENGGGSFLKQDQIRELLRECRAYGLNVIPEMPCLSHSDYLLTRHPELAENKKDPLPDTYCPSDPRVYELLFDLMDEVLDVFQPETVHIAHDEWYCCCMCENCAGRDPGDLFAEDVNKIRDYLKERGVKCMMWGDMIVSFMDIYGTYRGAGEPIRRLPTDRYVTYKGKRHMVYQEIWGKAHEYNEGILFTIANSISARNKIAKDIQIMNWFEYYNEKSDDMYRELGLQSVYGNFTPRRFNDWFPRIEKGVQGLSISNWSMLDQRHMQRNGILFFMVYSAMMLWNREFDESDRMGNTLLAAHDLYDYHYRDARKGAYAEIVHGTTVHIPHGLFVDGNVMNEDADRMGWYRIEYEDGTVERRDIYWGLNIGIVVPEWTAEDLRDTNLRTTEPTYTCDYALVDGKVYYKLLLPLEKKAVRIVPEFYEKYEADMVVKSISIFNGEEGV